MRYLCIYLRFWHSQMSMFGITHRDTSSPAFRLRLFQTPHFPFSSLSCSPSLISHIHVQAYMACTVVATASVHAATVSSRRKSLSMCILLALVALQIVMAGLRWNKMNQGCNSLVRQWVEAAFASIPTLKSGCILLVQGDTPMYVSKYLSQVEGFRPDVLVLEADMLAAAWYVRDIIPALPSSAVGLRFPPGPLGSHRFYQMLVTGTGKYSVR